MTAGVLGPRSSRRVGGGRVVWYDTAIKEFFLSPLSPVGLSMASRGARVLEAARRDVGVAKPDPLGRTRDRKVGQLRDSLTIQPAPGIKGPAVRVGSADPIAHLHHEGTRPHMIFPRSQGGSLYFWSENAHSMVFARQVSHPGTKPRHYLTRHLPLAIA